MRTRAKRPGKQRVNAAVVVLNPADSAEEAGLRYVSDDRPGYTRKPNGKGFDYVDIEGKQIRDEQRLLRIRRLAIPPAWTNVWICASANGHLQATGRDSRRRKQYRYHERWREVRDDNKFGRLADFAAALPQIRKRVDRDIKLPGLPREKVLATVVRLLERTFMRIGNNEYARQNKSFGLTTIKDRHVTIRGPHLRFRFRGKSGRQHEVDVRDGEVAKIISKLQDLPGQDLFQYIDDNGEVRDIGSQDVNDYLREITNKDFTAKDFRTWAGTLLSALALDAQGGFETKTQAKANIKTAICAVAELLGNTPTICRRCYVHPAVLETYSAAAQIPGLRQAMQKSGARRLRSAETAVLRFLRSQVGKI